MPELKQPLSLKEIFGRLRQVVLLREDTSSSDAGKERPVEGRDGALKVFLEEDTSSAVSAVRISQETNEILREELIPWLQVIAIQLGELTRRQITPKDVEGQIQ